ncbi:hypothetical protein [Benzoatithermus flavus]|uniref:SPOR domain-containing protein n=1 Tax=Benzoatithermus flavus TaxID=3108223 RepID=A0ABU8XTR4_9PROT
MTPQPNLTPEMLELLERRLADNVGERVERTLKMRYAGIVGAVLFVLGLAGYSWVENLVVKAIGPVSKDAERTIALMNVQLDLAKDNKKKLDALVEQINSDAAEAQRKIESFQARLAKQQDEFDKTLESINDQFGTIVMRRRELEADLAQNSRGVMTSLAETRAAVADLAKLANDLTRLAAAGREDAAQEAQRLQAEAQAILERAQRAVTGDHLATVFVQYGKSVPVELAHGLAEKLQGKGYIVPSEDRMPVDAREVRFFYPADREAANQLARDAMAELQAMGFANIVIDVRDFTGWAKAKPRAGTLELWIALPQDGTG